MNRLALGMALVIGFAVPADARRIVPNTHPFPAWLREIIDRTKADAERRETRELAAELAKAGRIDAASMGRHQKATVDVRRDIFQLRGEDQPLKGVRLVEVAEFVLLHDPDENVRTHAACGLGYSGLSLESRAGAVLAQALKDTSAGVRRRSGVAAASDAYSANFTTDTACVVNA